MEKEPVGSTLSLWGVHPLIFSFLYGEVGGKNGSKEVIVSFGYQANPAKKMHQLATIESCFVLSNL